MIKKLLSYTHLFKNYIDYNLKKTTTPLRNISAIELTNRCNQYCQFCPVNNKKVIKPIKRMKIDMPISEFENILKTYKKYIGSVDICHHGECFLYPKFREAVRLLKKYGVKYKITTNGSLIGKYLDVLEEYPPQAIMFSLYTLNPTKFKNLTKTGDLKQVLINIDALLDLKNKNKLNTQIIIRAINMYGFEDEVDKIKAFFEGKDVIFDINILNSWAGRVDVSKFGDCSKHIIDFKYCSQPWLHCIIGSNSGIYICNNHEDEPIGSLKNNTLEEIWNSKKYREIRKNILEGNYRKNKICANCDYFSAGTVLNKPTKLFLLDGFFLRKLFINLGLYKKSHSDMLKLYKKKYGKGN